MIAVSYKHPTIGWMIPYYYRDWQVRDAKKTFKEYETLHGKGNVKMEMEDNSQMIDNWYGFMRNR